MTKIMMPKLGIPTMYSSWKAICSFEYSTIEFQQAYQLSADHLSAKIYRTLKLRNLFEFSHSSLNWNTFSPENSALFGMANGIFKAHKNVSKFLIQKRLRSRATCWVYWIVLTRATRLLTAVRIFQQTILSEEDLARQIKRKYWIIYWIQSPTL